MTPGPRCDAEHVEPVARHVRDRNHGDAEGDRLDLVDGRVDVVGEVGLGEDEHRLRAALPGEREVALEAPEVQVLVDRGDDEDDVDVGGEDLLLRRLPGGLARELRAAREDGLDRPALLVGARCDGDPVADGREVGGRRSVVEAPGDVAAELAELGEDVVGAAMLHGNAAGRQPGSAWGSNCSARVSSQPSAVRSGTGGGLLSDYVMRDAERRARRERPVSKSQQPTSRAGRGQEEAISVIAATSFVGDARSMPDRRRGGQAGAGRWLPGARARCARRRAPPRSPRRGGSAGRRASRRSVHAA